MKVTTLVLTTGLVLASEGLLQGCSELPASPMAMASTEVNAIKLDEILAAREQPNRARDQYRHPKETLQFFGIRPGMKIAEVMPGSGWYTEILAPLVGSEGAIYGISFSYDMWDGVGIYSDEVIKKRVAKGYEYGDMVAGFSGTEGVQSKGYIFNDIDKNIYGSVDAVLFFRALHFLNYQEERTGARSLALQQSYDMLKPGGIVGVVQHRAPATAADDWANGINGYLKQESLVSAFEDAGFELVAASEINANSKDPVDGYVWRLPPFLRGKAEQKANMLAIGESDRMTLLFKKPVRQPSQ